MAASFSLRRFLPKIARKVVGLQGLGKNYDDMICFCNTAKSTCLENVFLYNS